MASIISELESIYSLKKEPKKKNKKNPALKAFLNGKHVFSLNAFCSLIYQLALLVDPSD